MTFRWLPDPERYAHPRLTWLLQWCFHVAIGWRFRIDHNLPPDFELPPGVLVVSNHLSDWDGPVLGSLLARREGLHMHGVVPFFATREDLFQRGAIANLVYSWPRPVLRLLRLLPLLWLFRNVRTVPMRRVREFTWHDTLRQLRCSGMGSRAPSDVFNARGLRELRRYLGTLPERVDAISP